MSYRQQKLANLVAALTERIDELTAILDARYKQALENSRNYPRVPLNKLRYTFAKEVCPDASMHQLKKALRLVRDRDFRMICFLIHSLNCDNYEAKGKAMDEAFDEFVG